MKAKSCFSINLDPYRAGIEVAEQLAEIKPEVIFLFTSIHYAGSAELLEAIYDILENDDLILIGNSGDGFYEKEKIANIGVCALGINSNNKAEWHIEYESGIKDNPAAAAVACLKRVNNLCPNTPAFYYLATDFRTDTCSLLKGLRQEAKSPVVGGSAADDFLLKSCFVYANRKVLTDSIVLLAVTGEINFSINIGQKMRPVGRLGMVSKSVDTRVDTIDDIPAMDFIEKQIGKPLREVDVGVVTLKVMDSDRKEPHLRSLLSPDMDSDEKSLSFFGSIEQGSIVQVCLASLELVDKDLDDIAGSLKDLPFTPVAGLVVTCAGRKKLLGSEIEFEVKKIVDNAPSLDGLAGFTSFGEFGPVKNRSGYSKPLFHNMTYILLLMGDIQC